MLLEPGVKMLGSARSPKEDAMDGRVKIGLVGYCPPTRFDEGKARAYLEGIFDKIAKLNPGREFALVSGLCNVGMLKIGYTEAAARGWWTIGVACAAAGDHEWFPVDEYKIVGLNWGDESDAFLEQLDGPDSIFVRIGRGEQSLREATLFRGQHGGDIDDVRLFEVDLPTLS